MNYSAEQIANITNGQLTPGSDNVTATFAFTDSREYSGGTGLFVAIVGERSDGHEYVQSMLEKGNIALIQDNRYAVKGTILVKNTELALADLARHYRLNEINDTKVIAVTGSVGKTGTKDMTALTVGAGKSVFKTPGNRNSNIGLPMTMLSVPVGTEAAVIEAGISEYGEMWQLSRMCVPDIAIITNIGYSHIQSFHTREGIRDEKLQILSHMRDGGTVIFNGDEPLLNGVAAKNIRRICCGINNRGCCVYAENITTTDCGLTFDMHLGRRKFHVELPVQGTHHVGNAMYAVTAAYLAGVDVDAAVAALRDFKQSGNRQNIYNFGGMTFIADYYNASPESMRAALAVLAHAEGRKVAVLADMLELGDFSYQLHAGLGRECVRAGVDLLITVGENAKLIAENAPDVTSFSFAEGDFAAAAQKLNEYLASGDTVLFKGSNKMNLGEIVKIIKGE